MRGGGGCWFHFLVYCLGLLCWVVKGVGESNNDQLMNIFNICLNHVKTDPK